MVERLTRKHLAHAALQRQRHDLAPAVPQLVRDAVHLHPGWRGQVCSTTQGLLKAGAAEAARN